ncbi:MAG: thiamine diphosphokinase [Anaerolineales bacterium]|nr:thiamine diphosphokinase [Anaerolineales bacterium]
MVVFVFANGDMESYEWLKPLLGAATAVLAANGGTNHLFRLERRPDVVVGDMDSLREEVRGWLAETDVSLITHPIAKDETDLELALLYAVAHYDAPIWVVGGFGGRLDQTLANILLLAHPQLLGRPIQFVTEHERAWLVAGKTRIDGEIGDTVSLIPLGGAVQVAQTSGLRWPLQDEVLAFGPARGVSNVLTAVTATVTLHSGTLLCIHTRQAWRR